MKSRIKKYLLPVSLGFAGMFVAHIIILIGFGSGIPFPLYFIAYPTVYTLLAFHLTKNHPDWWLSNVICILLIPFLYWYLLLWNKDKYHWTDALTFSDSGAMLLILPMTLLIATSISLSVRKRKNVNPNSR